MFTNSVLTRVLGGMLGRQALQLVYPLFRGFADFLRGVDPEVTLQSQVMVTAARLCVVAGVACSHRLMRLMADLYILAQNKYREILVSAVLVEYDWREMTGI